MTTSVLAGRSPTTTKAGWWHVLQITPQRCGIYASGCGRGTGGSGGMIGIGVTPVATGWYCSLTTSCEALLPRSISSTLPQPHSVVTVAPGVSGKATLCSRRQVGHTAFGKLGGSGWLMRPTIGSGQSDVQRVLRRPVLADLDGLAQQDVAQRARQVVALAVGERLLLHDQALEPRLVHDGGVDGLQDLPSDAPVA